MTLRIRYDSAAIFYRYNIELRRWWGWKFVSWHATFEEAQTCRKKLQAEIAAGLKI